MQETEQEVLVILHIVRMLLIGGDRTAGSVDGVKFQAVLEENLLQAATQFRVAW